MTLSQSLEELGFHRHEAAVYLALSELGASYAGPLIKRTTLHRQFVYQALDSLGEKGLVSRVMRRNRRFFQATRPSLLLEQEQRREKLVRQVVNDLSRLQQSQKDRLEVQVLFGKEEFFRNLQALVEVAARGDRTIRIVGGGTDSDFYHLLGRRYDDYRMLLRQARIKKYLLAPASVAQAFQRRFAKEPGNVLKLLDQGLSSPTYTRITLELVSIEIYAIEPMVIQIWNSAVARGFCEHFDLLWKRSQVFKKRKK